MSDERTPNPIDDNTPSTDQDAAADPRRESPILERQAMIRHDTPDRARRTVLIAFPMFFLACALVPLVAMLSHSREEVTVVHIESVVQGEAPSQVLASDALEVRDEPIGARLADGAASSVARPWRGVAASPGGYGVSAVWSETELFVSRDDGRTYRQVLGGPGDIGAAVVDEMGVVYMTRDYRRLGVYAYPDHESWHELPFAGDTLALAVGQDGWLAWLGLAHDAQRDAQVVLALSRDRGASWHTQTIAEHADRALLSVEDDGSVHMLTMVEDVRGPTMSRLMGHIDGRAVEPMTWPTDYADAWGLGHDGWAYAIASECATPDNDICAMGPGASAQLVSTHTRTEWDLTMASNGDSTLGVSGTRLLRFDGARTSEVADRVPTEISALAIDGIDRALAVRGRELLRYSPTHGWRVLLTRE